MDFLISISPLVVLGIIASATTLDRYMCNKRKEKQLAELKDELKRKRQNLK